MSNDDIYKRARSYITKSLIESLFYTQGAYWRKGEYWTLNPLRNDKNIGSFSISEGGVYNDFANDYEGDLFDLISKTRNISRLEAVKLILSEPGTIDHEPKKKHSVKKDKVKPLIPIPKNKVETLNSYIKSNYITQKYGKPVIVWEYQENNNTWCCVVRHENDGIKKVVPYYYGIDNKWHFGNPKKINCPLFNIDKIYNNSLPVLIVEGEKCASIDVNGYNVISWIGGCNQVNKSDWSPLLNRQVVIWPDADEAGIKAAKEIMTYLPHAKILNIESDFKGWDVADAKKESINLKNFISKCPFLYVDTENKILNVATSKDSKKGRPKLSELALEMLYNYPLCKGKGVGYLINKNQAIEIGSKQYKDFIRHIVYSRLGKPLNDYSLKEITGIQNGKALYESPERTVYVRVAAVETLKTYLDLCDEENNIIEITPDGWQFVNNPEVLFFRPKNLNSLPKPNNPGNLDSLISLFNLKNQEDYYLIRAALTFWLRGRPNNYGSYCGIDFTGPEGSAKTTAAKKLKFLIDPSTPETRMANDLKDLYIAAHHNHILSIDNLSKINRDYSDGLCSLMTSGAFATKTLYTDGDETIFEKCNPVILNGISYKKAPDLTQRLMTIELESISDQMRITESEIWEEMKRERPEILGGLLTALSNGLKTIKKGFKSPPLPRLADFGYFATALEIANNWPMGSTLLSLSDSYEASLDSLSEDNPALVYILKVVRKSGHFKGLASELLKIIFGMANDYDRRLHVWPKTAQELGSLISRNENVLKHMGLEIEKGNGRDRRTYYITYIDKNAA